MQTFRDMSRFVGHLFIFELMVSHIKCKSGLIDEVLDDAPLNFYGSSTELPS